MRPQCFGVKQSQDKLRFIFYIFLMAERIYKNADDVALHADFSDRGKVLNTESGVAIPVSIHAGCSNGVLSFEEKDGNMIIKVQAPADGSGYHGATVLNKEELEKLKKYLP